MGYFNTQHPTFLAEEVGAADHARGPADAAVTIVEYGDFACPYCRRAYPMLKDLLTANPDVRFVFRANPRSHLFADAQPAAEAAEAAAAQGKFWEMHDRLFEIEGGLARDALVAHAREIGLDVARFERELTGHAHLAAVKRQEVSGWHSHVLSTPTFFVNGMRFEDAPDALPAAVARARREKERIHHVYREARVHSTTDRRRQVVTVGPHQLVSDLPVADDGNETGPSPTDLLLAALGTCTAMTVQWSADRYKLPLRAVDVRLTQSHTETGHLFRQEIVLDGDLTEAQRAQLEHAADGCPVSRILMGEVALDTRVTVGSVGDPPTSR